MFQPLLPLSYPGPVPLLEPKGVVYTKPWVVELVLDLAKYTEQSNLVDALAVEPAAGEGAFLVPMVMRLVASCLRQKRPLTDCKASLIAYELNERSAEAAREAVTRALSGVGIVAEIAESLAEAWVRTGDFLLDVARLPRADYVIGNPPYVRLEDIPAETASIYRDSYSTMRGRADLYVAFFEAALRKLKPSGVCAYICADRWMLNQYGAELRSFVTTGFGVEAVVEMHNADPFDDEVSAYPAVTVIRRQRQGKALVASAGLGVDSTDGGTLAASLQAAVAGESKALPKGLTVAVVESWFSGSDPWPCSSPGRLALLRRLEDQFEPLESETTETKVGIGVATGLDKVYITKNEILVESSRLLPLAMAQDTITGQFLWSGHFLVNPWEQSGLINLKAYPRLQAYFDVHQEEIRKRNTAQRNPEGRFRTIDRVNVDLSQKKKLYIPDIKNVFDPVLDEGKTYPHHNLYYLLSERWDLEVLGGLLISSIGQLFIEAYGVKMRGGYLRFQAQYLRRIRVPNPDQLTVSHLERLRTAFRKRDRQLATSVALEVYQVKATEIEIAD